MDLEIKKLKCPECGKEYGNYREYFACWTSHLRGSKPALGSAPSSHADAIKYYVHSPNDIEKGLVILASEVGVFRGRIDLIGVDVKNQLVLIDVTTNRNWKPKVKQLKKYKGYIEWIGKNVFGVSLDRTVRLLVVKPNSFVKDVTPRSYYREA